MQEPYSSKNYKIHTLVLSSSPQIWHTRSCRKNRHNYIADTSLYRPPKVSP